MNFRFLGWMLVIGLAGCAGWRPPLSALGQQELAWLKQLDQFELQGRVGVRGNKGSWHGSLRWTYRDNRDRVVVSGPFGQGGVVIQVQENWIQIEQADGQIRVSDQPDQLLEEILGVAVPLQALRYWIRGLPAPGQAQTEYAPDGRLQRLIQAGWQVEYLEYQRVGQGALPAKLVLAGPRQVRLKLVIDRWETTLESEQA